MSTTATPETETAAERRVREEQEAHDAEQAAAAEEGQPEVDDDDGKALFDRSQYDREELALPRVDGQAPDKIRVKFTGSIMLDRMAPVDVALWRKLTLGKDVELRVAGEVTNVGTGRTTGKDGDLDAIVGERTVKVGTVWVLEPEDL